MRRDVYARLVELEAPLAPLHRIDAELARSPSGKKWHRWASHSPSSTCPYRSSMSEKSAIRVTVTLAELYEQNFELCSAPGCDETSRSVSDYLRALQRAARGYDRCVVALENADWVAAMLALESIERTSRQVENTRSCEDITGDDLGEFVRWADGLVAEFAPRIADGQSAMVGRIRRAFAAVDVPLDVSKAHELGADLALARVAREAWLDAIERLLDEEGNAAEMALDAVEEAASLLGVDFTEQPYRKLVEHWNGLADCYDFGPGQVALLVRGQSGVGPPGRSFAAWARLAANCWPSVTHGTDRMAALVPPAVAAKVRSEALHSCQESNRYCSVEERKSVTERNLAVIEGVDAGSFAERARCALSLWEPGGEGVLAYGSAAWDAAAALLTTSA